VLGCCGFASTFTMRLLDPMVPDLAREFSVSIAEVAVFATAFGLSYAASQPILGPLADGFGKMRTIRIALFALAAVLAVSAFATSYGQMMALRALSGAVAGGVIPVALAAIGDRVELAERQVAIGRFLVMIIVGQMAGAAVSGLVADRLGWRAVFLMAGCIAATAGALAILLVQARPRPPTPPSLASVAAGYRSVFANPMTPRLYALVAVGGAFSFGAYPFVAGVLAERAGTSASEAGLVIGASGVGGILYGMFVRRIVGAFGQRRMSQAGGVATCLALAGLALPLPWWTAFALFLIHGFAFYLIHNTLQTYATELSESARGAAVSLFAACFFVGNAMGPLLMGLFKLAIGLEWGFVVMGLGALAVGCLAPAMLGLGAGRPRT
jgi:predicted MFS family arabinose efflux permease